MEDFIQMSYLYDVFLRSTAKLPATSRQPEVTYTSCAKFTLLRYSSGLEPGDSSPVSIRPCSRVELRTVDYENPGSNPGCGVKTLGKFFHATLLQFTQLNK